MIQNENINEHKLHFLDAKRILDKKRPFIQNGENGSVVAHV